MIQIKDKITVHFGLIGFGRERRFNSGNPYTSYYLGFIRVDKFDIYIGY